MPTAFICHCHDWDEQGQETADGLTEWQIAQDVDRSILDHLFTNSPVMPLRLNRTLDIRIDTVNMFCKIGGDMELFSPPYIAIETHCNWVPDKTRRGFHVMAYHTSTKGRELARRVLFGVAKARGRGGRNMGVNFVDAKRQWIGTEWEYENKRQAFVSKTECPAVLVESCFLSNTPDAFWISQEYNRRKLGRYIAEAIINYYQEVQHV